MDTNLELWCIKGLSKLQKNTPDAQK